MHTYTILRALVLSLGTASVIARSLPGRRSEVNARVAGGHESSNTSKNPEAADANVDTVVSSATTNIDDLKDRFERMGLVMISEGMLGEEVYTRTYSITANTTFSIGGTTLEKREINVEGEKCTPHCLQMNPGPNPDDCATLYSELNGQATQISVKPHNVSVFTVKTCTAVINNNTGDTLLYNYPELASTTQSLNGACIRNNAGATAVAVCLFGGHLENRVSIILGHRDIFAASQS